MIIKGDDLSADVKAYNTGLKDYITKFDKYKLDFAAYQLTLINRGKSWINWSFPGETVRPETYTKVKLPTLPVYPIKPAVYKGKQAK